MWRKTRSWSCWSPTADLAGYTLPQWQTFEIRDATLAVSADGTIVDFGFEQVGKSPLRFDLRALKLSQRPTVPISRRIWPTQTGLAVEGWRNGSFPDSRWQADQS